MQPGAVMDAYKNEVFSIIQDICDTEKEHIIAAAKVMANQVKKDRLIYVFGPGGHSNMAAMEMFFRAGGLMHVSAMLNQETMMQNGALKSMQVERLPGYGRIIVNDYDIGNDDLLIVANAYGMNSATIDAALQGRENGATVIGVSSVEHASSTPPEHPARHPSRRNLHDIVDYHVDCKVKVGDAVLVLPNLEQKIGPLSTFANAFTLNCMVIECINLLTEEGIDPPIWMSANATGGEAWNAQFIERFRSKIRCF